MFSTVREPFGSLIKIKLINNVTGEYLAVIPSFGGNINELELRKNEKLHAIILGDDSEESLRTFGGSKYYGAKLSPFPNRIKGGKYVFEGKEYQLPRNEKNKTALHGFIWDKEFDIVKEEAVVSHAELTLVYTYTADVQGYPFEYKIVLEYRLNAAGFECETKIKNLSTQNIPMGDGWHPYFRTGNLIDNLFLKLPSARMIETDESLIPNGRVSFVNECAKGKIIGSDKFDNCFGPIEAIDSSSIAITELMDNVNDIKIEVWQETGKNKYNYIQIYTPADRASIVIEPMTCAPDAFNSGEGLIVLKPDEEISLKFGIRLK